ncbi:YIP1 family protein [Paenibacillus nasutitermitis]|uniref:Yip1 domain-containing protein n=1 Tax=Paenibacillus nasutitermitis TaxID=1652958 RepID=A0A916Z7E8_9BACL|nr:YIP1 family protein [Paenibacillus nasutitermitis]GGD79820.1 hypothetical protein GCM10010911_42400 [Paenibacillus nasutitermitis]
MYVRKHLLKCLLALALVAGGLMVQAEAYAAVPYDTFARDGYGKIIYAKSAYYPMQIVGKQFPETDPEHPETKMAAALSSPQDLFIDSRDHLYIADTGNNRIVEFNPAGGFVRQLTVPESPLSKPEGVFVDASGELYVADTGNARIVRLSATGEMIREYKRPDSRFIPEDFQYDPIKIVVDERGYLYICSRGGYLGLLQLSPEGQFQRFFGANPTPFSAIDAFKRAVYTKKMYENEKSKLPPPPNNVMIDGEGLVYTVTSQENAGVDQVKKLNYKGTNILVQSDKFGTANRTFGEMTSLERYREAGKQPHLVDVAVDREGNLTLIDDSLGYVSHYDANGRLLYFWGGAANPNTTQRGLIRSPVAVSVNSSGELFILDDEENVVHTFGLTDFSANVLKANRLSMDGQYLQSKPIWSEISHALSSYTPALTGLAQAAYEQGNYSMAAELFREAGNQKGYSESFWKIRIQWFQEQFSTIATIAALLLISFLLIGKLTKNTRWRSEWRDRKKSQHPFFVQSRHWLYVLRHPFDGFTALRYENKGSYISAFLILALVLASIVFSAYYTSFSFSKTMIERISLLPIVAPYVFIWLGWVVCNYLVSSIYRGEGRFRDTFIGSSYAMLPILIVGVLLAIMSNAMTLSESAIYSYLNLAMQIWSGLLLFWSVQTLQNYQFGETVVNVSLTLLAMLVLGVLVFIVFGLTSELRSFIVEVYQEVIWR